MSSPRQPKTGSPGAGPLMLICGEDEFSVKQRAGAVYERWCQEVGGMDYEKVDGQVGNSGDALKSIGKLREGLNTLPFFGGGKVLWWQNVSFFAEDRTSASQAVTSALAELAAELTKFQWGDVRLLISAGKIDKRRVFYKTLEKVGQLEWCASWESDPDWAGKAEDLVRKALVDNGLESDDSVIAAMVTRVGPQPRQLSMELEKLCLYVTGRKRVEISDVEAIVTPNKRAQAFAVAEALGDRDLAKALRSLDEELWEMQFDRERSEFGLLYGMISKVRAMIGVSELVRMKQLREQSDWRGYTAQAKRIPEDLLPTEKRFNPAALHPFVISKTIVQCRNYTIQELVKAMELLLVANRRLVTSSLDERMVLQQLLVEIIGDGGRGQGRKSVAKPVVGGARGWSR